MKKTTVYLSQDQLDELDALANRTGKPKALLIREAVAEYIIDQEPELPTLFGIAEGDGGDLSSLNVRSWLKENWDPE
jgi:predicted transcriptional regulator